MDVIQASQQALGNLDRSQIATFTTALRNLTGRAFILGNGGSHGAHMAADLRKIGRIEAYAWGENVHDLTAYVNDEGWASACVNWLMDSHCGARDTIIILSVGGASREVSVNLKETIYWAKGGPTILGIVGTAGGYVAQYADHSIIIPSFSTPVVEGLTAVVWHHVVAELAR